MPPETPPPDDERRTTPSSASEGGNVVDPEVLAERRAQRAEQAEQSAARRAADAQVLAAQLARERARIEAERDAARAEADAAREGADAAIAEARHLQAERDALRAALDEAQAALAARPAAGAPGTPEPPAAAAPLAPAAPAPAVPAASPQPAAAANGHDRNGHAAPPIAWPAALRRELAVARATAGIAVAPAVAAAPAALVPGLARERRLVAQRAAAAGPAAGAKPLPGADAQRRGDRAAPVTALALERERSSRLQAQLDSSLAVQRELRTHIAALQRAVHQRVEAERRIETALRRVREELTAANALAARPMSASTAEPREGVRHMDGLVHAARPEARSGPPRAAAGTGAPAIQPMPAAAEPAPAPQAPPAAAAPEPAPQVPPATEAPAGSPVPPAAPAAVASRAPVPVPSVPAALAPAVAAPRAPAPAGLDPLRLSAARERLRAAAPSQPYALPAGPPAPWLTDALRRLLASDPQTAGRIAIGVLPAHGLAAEHPLRWDLLLAGRGCLAIDVAPGTPTTVTPRAAPRPRSERDLSVAGDAAGVARLLHGKRTLLRRPARVRGGRKALRELRRIARAPIGLRQLGEAGVALEPALALRLVALAIDPAATQRERFAIAHAPLAGGPVDAWLRVADGAEPEVVTQAPAEPTRLTLRCTRGALLALIAGVAPPPGESGTLDGDDAALALLRRWIARTERPAD